MNSRPKGKSPEENSSSIVDFGGEEGFDGSDFISSILETEPIGWRIYLLVSRVKSRLTPQIGSLVFPLLWRRVKEFDPMQHLSHSIQPTIRNEVKRLPVYWVVFPAGDHL
jgi:hypothetical protein